MSKLCLLSFPLYIFKDFVQNWLTGTDISKLDRASTNHSKRQTLMWMLEGTKLHFKNLHFQNFKLCCLWMMLRKLSCRSLEYARYYTPTVTVPELQCFKQLFALEFIVLEGKVADFLSFVVVSKFPIKRFPLKIRTLNYWKDYENLTGDGKLLVKRLYISSDFGDKYPNIKHKAVEHIHISYEDLSKIDFGIFKNVSKLSVMLHSVDTSLRQLTNVLHSHSNITTVECILNTSKNYTALEILVITQLLPINVSVVITVGKPEQFEYCLCELKRK